MTGNKGSNFVKLFKMFRSAFKVPSCNIALEIMHFSYPASRSSHFRGIHLITLAIDCQLIIFPINSSFVKS